MHRPEHLPAALGWPLTHLRCRLPRLLIAAGSQGTRGGQQVQQGVFGDADAAADADRAQLAAGDCLVELVAPDAQDGCGLAGGEHLGQRGHRAGGWAGEVDRRDGGGRWLAVRAVARLCGGWPWLLPGAWCCGRRRPVCPAVGGGGGTIPRSRAQVWSVFPGGRAHRAAMSLRGWRGDRRHDSAGEGVVAASLWNKSAAGAGSRACRRRPR